MAGHTLLGITAGACLTLYGILAGARSYEMHRKLEPIRQEFADTAYTTNFEVYEPENFGDPIKKMDFYGRLDDIVERRERFLDDNGCFLLGGWSVMSPDSRTVDISVSAPVICPLL